MEAHAGSKKAEEHARLMRMKNVRLDEEQTHAGPKNEKTEKEEVPAARPEEEGSEPKVSAGTKKKKVVVRLCEEYVSFIASLTPLPPFQRLPILNPLFIEIQESFLAREKADREERESILKQFSELGYADLEIEVTDDEEDEVRG